ncbi:hypothetical protein Cflav_PD1748 [Pedosphaera parvula Ellin514]|uniref:Uncharacterized protein n=1 Tax=Pedosphaera parvula (strain Ellin514) TaxID=320771 RepID=B9XNL8_PEDPL|nr:hypothetical protein Cflav_PD1748 [Pedosphaera parvula Ellin514]
MEDGNYRQLKMMNGGSQLFNQMIRGESKECWEMNKAGVLEAIASNGG